MIKQKITYSCDFCGATESKSYIIGYNGQLISPTIPDGWWSTAEGLMCCSRHRVTMTVDEKTFLFKWNAIDSIYRNIHELKKMWRTEGQKGS